MMRGFAVVQVLGSIVTIFIAIIVWGLPMIPSLLLIGEVGEKFSSSGNLVQAFTMGIAISTGIVLWGIFLLLFSGILQLLIHPRIKEEKSYPLASAMTIRWAITALLHRLTSPILTHLVPSFIGNWYYRLCGCKIGKNAQINSKIVNDSYAVEIGAGTVVGGDAIINCHLVEDGRLILSPVKIGSGVTIGGGVSILPGSIIGDDAIIAYRAVVIKRTEVGAGEVWGGLPAKKIR